MFTGTLSFDLLKLQTSISGNALKGLFLHLKMLEEGFYRPGNTLDRTEQSGKGSVKVISVAYNGVLEQRQNGSSRSLNRAFFYKQYKLQLVGKGILLFSRLSLGLEYALIL